MKRTIVALLILASTVGCSMCQHPYDHTGPVPGAGGCPHCGYNYRQGSAISAPPDGNMAPSYQPTPANLAPPTYQSAAPTPAKTVQ